METAVTIWSLFSPEELNAAIAEGLVTQRFHPELPLVILNYTPKAQYSGTWNNVTTNCRGLIYQRDSCVIISRPFPKFHNINTQSVPETLLENLPTTPYEVTKKLDGSLGILWRYAGKYGVATRGSFASDQAVWATNWLHEHFKDKNFWSLLMKNEPATVTFLFEIIYPENRIVVDYEGKEGLIVLAAIDNKTGEEISRKSLETLESSLLKLPVVPIYNHELAECLKHNTPNEEGYVITWRRQGQPSLKVKVKFEDYCRLHRIMTGMNPKDVWELYTEKPEELDALILDFTLPAHFREWLMGWVEEFLRGIDKWTSASWRAYRDVQTVLGKIGETATRKDYALQFQQKAKEAGQPELLPMLFAWLDKKDVLKIIYKVIKPKAADTFKKDGDE